MAQLYPHSFPIVKSSPSVARFFQGRLLEHSRTTGILEGKIIASSEENKAGQIGKGQKRAADVGEVWLGMARSSFGS